MLAPQVPTVTSPESRAMEIESNLTELLAGGMSASSAARYLAKHSSASKSEAYALALQLKDAARTINSSSNSNTDSSSSTGGKTSRRKRSAGARTSADVVPSAEADSVG